MNPQQNGGGYPQPENNQNHDAIHGTAVVCALGSTIILAPFLNNWTIDFVSQLFISQYGESMAEIFKLGWKSLIFAFTYYFSMTYIYLSIVSLSVFILSRLPVAAL